MLLYDPEFPPSNDGSTSSAARHSGQAAAHAPDEGVPPASQDARIFRDANGVTWWVHEVNGEYLGARGATCLLVVSALDLRRVWRYPANWRSLAPEELLRLPDQRSPRTDAL